MSEFRSIASLRELTDVASLSAEVCVVGSGAGGGIFAAEVARAGIEVLLVEMGAFGVGAPPDSTVSKIEVTGDADIQFGRALQFGGSSNLWAGRIAPLEGIDFEARSWVPGSGWPITLSDLIPYYNRAAELLGVPPDPFVLNEDHSSAFSALDGSGVEMKAFRWAHAPFNVADYLVRQTKEWPSLRILLDAPVVKLAWDDGNQSIRCAQIRRPDGSILPVHAKKFVVAAGGIETPRLFLNSVDAGGTAVGNSEGLVGRYLSTHPKADIGVLLTNNIFRTNSPLFSEHRTSFGRARLGLGFSEAGQRRDRLLNHYVQLSPLTEYRSSRLFELVKGRSLVQSPLINRSAMARNLLSNAGYMAFEAIGKIAKLQPRARTFVMRAFLDQYPNPDNRISLSSEVDIFGMRKANIDWKFTDSDRESLLIFLRRLQTAVIDANLGRVDFTELANSSDWPITALHSHFMGTTRMGENPKAGVVDRDCRVFGCKNLFVAGPSVFSAYGYANPFYTIAALALRLADRIVKS